MATYDKLPVFKQTYDLLLKIFNLSHHFNKDVRYTLGEQLKKDVMGMLKLIYQANTTHQKCEYIAQARVDLVGVRLQIRLLFDMKQMTIKQYAVCCVEVESISKQLTAWEAYSKKQNSSNNESR